jgi:CCR4-NOT transcription complex subunit 9
MAALNIMNNNDIELYVQQLINPATRENALLELSKKRENFPDLAPYLWYSFGTIAALLQEIVSIYPLLSPPALTAHGSNRVCNALALLQCVASHPETRGLFLQGELASVSRVDTCWLGLDLIDVRTSLSDPFARCAAHVPLFLYPFLNTVSKTRPFEYLRLTSLGVIGALVKVSILG